MYVGILLILLAFIFFFPASMLQLNAVLVNILIAIPGISGLLLLNVGPIICSFIPHDLGLRKFTLCTILMQLLSVTFGISQFLMPTTQVIGYCSLICILLAATLFLVFIYQIANYIQRPDLVRRTRNVFLFGAIVFLLVIPGTLFLDFVQLETSLILLAVLCIFVFTLLFVSYANLFNAVSDAIRWPSQPKGRTVIA